MVFKIGDRVRLVDAGKDGVYQEGICHVIVGDLATVRGGNTDNKEYIPMRLQFDKYSQAHH